MPRFFFHVYDDTVATDEEGAELPGIEAALIVAAEGARGLACEQIASGRLNLSHRIEVADAHGSVVGVVRFADAIVIEGLH
jgi:hypothetical protein